ncbi:MAG: class I tRNA ligase family protein [Minisyncoccales bacterium]
MEQNFNQREEKIIKFWNNNKIFEKSVNRAPKKRRDFVFYEGPPTANARPGIHHLETRVFKDMVCRYKTMAGFRVERRAGWDTHGLPVELQIEKKLGLHNKKEIEQYGIKEFNKQCRDSVFEQIKEWRALTERVGYWLDMDNAYITYDSKYMESVWFILKTAWEKKLMFQDYKVVPYCPRCGTALSSHEVAQGYKKVKELSIFVKFRVVNPEIKDTSLLVWTTTPWTLPANVAAAVNPKMNYVKAKPKDAAGGFLILAKSRFGVLGENYEIVEEMKGDKLVGLRYQAVYPVPDESKKTIYKVIIANFVSLEDGSGIVHIAPAFGAEDMEAIRSENKKLRAENLPEFPVVMNVGEDGAFTFDSAKWAGMFVKDADLPITKDLEERGLLFKSEIYEHDYPFCWRCKTPLLYYAKKSWFIEMTRLRDDLIKNNQTINWVPGYLKDGRFGEWLREVKDWAISRDRYWGTPLPAWKCECGHTQIMGSVRDLLDCRYSQNRYFIFRHGHSARQVKKISSSWPEPEPLPLTEQGRKKVGANAKKLAKGKIDLIISSDLLRAKETAQIISQATGAKIVYDKRLRELNVGALNGQDPKLFWDFINAESDRLNAKPRRGESLVALRRRVYEFIFDVDKKYENKTIVFVSHEMPLTILEWTLEGMELETIIDGRYSGKIKKIDTGVFRPIDYKELPFNDRMEIDLHRPYIDQVMPICPKCNAKMRRTPEVLDCWLDSGSMPFAQIGWPRGKNQSKNEPPKLFPADFISEAIDQTRGWFYTLLSVSAVLGFGASYKNVVSLGHVLDEKGEKMSKSKGNVIDPREMIEKYCADAVRWYFYTVNDPGDPKLYNEKDLDQAVKKFLLTFWNCHIFLQTYAPGIKAPKTVAPAHVLDRWIVSRLNETIMLVGGLLEKYDIAPAARALESFAINDLSLWYVRRSRRRLQQPVNPAELKQAAKIFAYVLADLAKITAPFTPFLSEEIYQKLSGNDFAKPKSVHLEEWPQVSEKLIDKNLGIQMARVRELVAAALAERAKRGVKVRQPLAKMIVAGNPLDEELIGLLAGEVNVKAIEFNPGSKTPMEFDWTITPALEEEGNVRETMRQIQELRKTAKFTPADKIIVYVQAEGGLKAAIEKNQSMMAKETKAVGIEFGKPAKPAAQIEAKVGGRTLWIGIKKC